MNRTRGDLLSKNIVVSTQKLTRMAIVSSSFCISTEFWVSILEKTNQISRLGTFIGYNEKQMKALKKLVGD